MGHVKVKVKISNVSRAKVVEVDALVDTGAILTVIPRRIADMLNLRPTGKQLLKLLAVGLNLSVLGRG